MQDLIICNKKETIIQANGKCYQDTTENFLADYGKAVEYEAIDYNRETQGCWLNGRAFQPYPNEVCEDILNSINVLLVKKAEREHVEPTKEEIQKMLTDGVQSYMDKKAQERGYDDIHTACSYANSTDEVFKQEGTACLAWRDSVWRKCYTILDEVKAGKRAIPTLEEVIAELPVLVW